MTFKKIIFCFVMLLATVGFVPNVFAAKAYSVGCKYASGTGYTEDTSSLATTAATGYGFVSDISSYYNTDATYSYISSISRLGGSRVFFIAGHANFDNIIVASRNESAYKTGISMYHEGLVSNGYTYAGLEGRSMSSTKVITFAGCNTAKQNFYSIADKAVAQGASAAVGWRYNTGNNADWLKIYNYSLGYGYTVEESINRATAAYGGTSTAIYWDIKGNRSTRITSSGLAKSDSNLIQKDISEDVKSDPIYQEISKKLSETYLSLKFSSIKLEEMTDDIFNKNLNDYVSLFKTIIDTIKLSDSGFNPENYKLTYRIIDVKDGAGSIYFTYYINNQIQTNKTYMVIFDNYEVKEILLSGVKKVNISNIERINEIDLFDKITIFKENKANILLEKISHTFITKSILSSDGKINFDSLNSEITNFEEDYYYDYNTDQLKYRLEITRAMPGNTYSTKINEIEL